MREVKIRPLAQTELEGIWQYTHSNWGVKQATHYLKQIDIRIKNLAHDPQRGHSLEDIRKGYHFASVNRHIIIYTFTNSTIGIERVLHERMNPKRHI